MSQASSMLLTQACRGSPNRFQPEQYGRVPFKSLPTMSLDHPRFVSANPYRQPASDFDGKKSSSTRYNQPSPYPYRSQPGPHYHYHRHHHHRHHLDHDSLHLAYDCILGLPFRGSLAHVGVIGSRRTTEPTCIRRRGQGPADVRWTLQTGAEQMVVHAISSGFADGNQARLIVNGVDYSLNCRGINMILIDPSTLDIRSASFDTHLYAGDGNAGLQDFVADAGRHPGWVFAVAVKDDAATNLVRESRLALESLGVNLGPLDDAVTLQRLLMERGNVLPPREASILMNMAARMDACRCIEVLAQYGWNVNINALTGPQNTPLHDAIRRGNKAAARTLFALGADSTLFNRDRKSADDLARSLHKAPSAIDYARSGDVQEIELMESVYRELII